MKRIHIGIMLCLLAAWTGCGEKVETSEIVTVDVTGSCPEKKMILQDFMELEYVPLESSDEFVTQGGVMAIGDKYIVVKNWSNDGDIFLFDRKTGKGLKKLNHRGQGAEEYVFINGIVLDEDKEELFVNCASTKKILVYDLSGNFKRSLKHAEGAEYLDVFNYDANNLICYDMSVYYSEGKKREKPFYHMIVSKQDGGITKGIPVPFDVVNAPFIQEGDGVAVASVCPIVPYKNNWLLVETSTDTVYRYVPQEDELSPFLVKNATKEPEIFLTMGTMTERYYFMQAIKKEFDFTKGRGFPSTGLMYDKQENAFFDAVVLNSDFVKEQRVDMISHPVNGKIATFQILTANQLVEAYNNQELKGRLKEIAATLNEESNPVLLLMKCKDTK